MVTDISKPVSSIKLVVKKWYLSWKPTNFAIKKQYSKYRRVVSIGLS